MDASLLIHAFSSLGFTSGIHWVTRTTIISVFPGSISRFLISTLFNRRGFDNTQLKRQTEDHAILKLSYLRQLWADTNGPHFFVKHKMTVMKKCCLLPRHCLYCLQHSYKRKNKPACRRSTSLFPVVLTPLKVTVMMWWLKSLVTGLWLFHFICRNMKWVTTRYRQFYNEVSVQMPEEENKR